MLHIVAFEVREDEKKEFCVLAEELGVQITCTEEVPSTKNVDLLDGCVGVSILGQGAIRGELLDLWRETGIRYLSTYSMQRETAYGYAMPAMRQTAWQSSQLC